MVLKRAMSVRPTYGTQTLVYQARVRSIISLVQKAQPDNTTKVTLVCTLDDEYSWREATY